jgi:hypothetical protein
MLRDWPADKTACPKSPPPVSEDVDEHLGEPERRKVQLRPLSLGQCAFPSRGSEDINRTGRKCSLPSVSGTGS